MNSAGINSLDKLSVQKLVLLGIGSVLLCLSLLLSVFAPYPLILAVVLFGRSKGFTLGLTCLTLVFLLSALVFGDLSLFVYYLFCFVLAIAISEVMLRGLSPVRSLVALGLGINGLIFGLILGVAVSTGQSIKELAINFVQKNSASIEQMKEKIQASSGSISKESIEMLSLLSEPELMAKQLLETAPSYIFMAVFFLLWVNLFLALSAKNALGNTLGKYNERVLINFRVPDGFVWLVIVALVCAIWGTDLGYAWLEPAGMTILTCLGVFYFFQGFGIYLDFLSFAKIRGFFRTFLIVITVFSANQVIAVLGLFDMFINFRRFFIKK